MKHLVAIVDDHTLLSQAISELVNGFANFHTLYTCKNGQELIDNLERDNKHPEIVLMDVNMPILNGINTTAKLKEKYPNIKVLALSVEESENTIIEMLRAGAVGYLMKDTEKDILQYALNQTIEKGFYHSNSVSEALIHAINIDQSSILKEREIEFIKLACTEMTYKEIAKEMYVSPKTIEGYRDSVYEKLKIKNRIGLVLYALKNKLIKL